MIYGDFIATAFDKKEANPMNSLSYLLNLNAYYLPSQVSELKILAAETLVTLHFLSHLSNLGQSFQSGVLAK